MAPLRWLPTARHPIVWLWLCWVICQTKSISSFQEINPNANLGHDVTYSGTVTAAMEAAIWKVPGVAVSLDSPENHLGELDYATAAKVAVRVVRAVLEKGLEPDVLLNVNVPYLPEAQLKGLKITRLGLKSTAISSTAGWTRAAGLTSGSVGKRLPACRSRERTLGRWLRGLSQSPPCNWT